MKDLPRVSVKELAHKIKGYGNPRFSFFLGAGASRQSDIITAGEMIRHFKERIIAQCCPESAKTDKEKEEWLLAQEWYKESGSEYCKLFERFEPKEIGRQRYIESIIEGREPSFGYVVLANLMANKYINTIITTNFDDLVYSACTTFTGIRPIVYAYGVMASEMRITAQRPKILKLHGDFLYSAIKNTKTEIEVQDPNMARQLRQVLSEYGLIVVGYSGGDTSIMEILSQISERNDLYWCVRRGEEPNEAVKELLKSKEGFLVEIDGFDEMMNEIRRIVEFDVQKMVGSIQERQNQMIEQFKRFEPQYSADILGEIAEALQEPTANEEENKKIQAIGFFSRAYKAGQAGDPSKAEELYRKTIELNPDYTDAYNNLGVLLLRDRALYAEAEALFRKAIELKPDYASAYNNLGVLLSKDAAHYAEAEAAYRKAIELKPDYANAYNNLGLLLSKDAARYAEAEAAYHKAIELKPDDFHAYYNLGMLLGDTALYAKAEAAYRKAIELKPDYFNAHRNLRNLLHLQGRNTEALHLAERTLQFEPQNPEGLLALASIHKSLGHKIESSEYAIQARKLMKADEWYNLACLESVCGNADAAIENLRRAGQEGSLNRNWAWRDPDLKWIRDDPRFSEIVGQEGT
ncbi:MAG TPA: tetratricopeptide repeat protein [Pyrinomonadaceae bacterium]|jgi:tetratricopeptide (TPR) repeat protein|nr:tetratricopeptide repeat protein [Pyrinomonadaceae bacterium]